MAHEAVSADRRPDLAAVSECPTVTSARLASTTDDHRSGGVDDGRPAVSRTRDLDQDTLDRRRHVLGHDHPDTLASAANLATDLRALGEAEDGP